MIKRFIFAKNITLKKFVNFCLIIFQHTITKNSFVIGYPIELVVDPIDACNLHCPLCPTGQGRKERSRGKMSFNNFKRIVDEIGKYLYRIDLHNWGEPLLNDDIFDMIRYAHDRGIEVRVSTNLNFLDANKVENLVRSGLDELIVSLDGVSQETYEKYRVGGDFNKVIKGIKAIIEKKKELNKFTPFITWQFLVMAHNESEIPKAYKMAKILGVDKFELLPIHSDMGRELFLDRETRVEIARKWLPHDEKYNMYNIKRKKVYPKPKTCSFLWVQSVINWNGSISPCCSVYPEKYDFGNMFDSNFKNIWNNAKYKASRKMVRQRRVHDIDLKTVCADCINNKYI
ncbi:MAG: radical SAM protein [Gammaproteobacteria bacterium]|nr:radical SAM protein [Gammaproteobacteria bacterium]